MEDLYLVSVGLRSECFMFKDRGSKPETTKQFKGELLCGISLYRLGWFLYLLQDRNVLRNTCTENYKRDYKGSVNLRSLLGRYNIKSRKH